MYSSFIICLRSLQWTISENSKDNLQSYQAVLAGNVWRLHHIGKWDGLAPPLTPVECSQGSTDVSNHKSGQQFECVPGSERGLPVLVCHIIRDIEHHQNSSTFCATKDRHCWPHGCRFTHTIHSTVKALAHCARWPFTSSDMTFSCGRLLLPTSVDLCKVQYVPLATVFDQLLLFRDVFSVWP